MVIIVENKKVVFLHTNPDFDTSGMIEVQEEIPESENNGKVAILHYDNGFYYEYEEPEPDVEIEEIIENYIPEKISKLQLKVQLVLMGYDLQLIEDAIKQLTEPHRTVAMLAWTDATNIYRDNSFITMVAQILQLTEKQVDQIFIEGEKIKL